MNDRERRIYSQEDQGPNRYDLSRLSCEGPDLMAETSILTCENLSFAFPSGPRILDACNLGIEAGSFVVIQGPSGSGKSTFLRLMNRLEEPTNGVIRFKSTPLSAYPPPELRRSVSYIHQTPVLVEGSIWDNLRLPFTFKRNHLLSAPQKATIRGLLDEFLLSDVELQDNALSLSGGQRQRLCLMRSILLSPDVLLLDEPVSSLDGESRAAVQTIIEDLNIGRGITIMLVSHAGFESKRVRSRTLTLKDGHIIE